MKNFVVILLAFLASCAKDFRTETAVNPDECKVTKLRWKKESTALSSEDAIRIAAQLAAAAEADANKSGKINASGNMNTSIQSELAKIVKQNIEQESDVDPLFWQQELTFRQSLCYLDALSKRKDLTKDQQKQILDDIRKLIKSRTDYTFELEKKRAGINP